MLCNCPDATYADADVGLVIDVLLLMARIAFPPWCWQADASVDGLKTSTFAY